MGRCQGGFCQERVLEIIARELGEEWCEIPLHGPGSEVLRRDTRPNVHTFNNDQGEQEGVTQ